VVLSLDAVRTERLVLPLWTAADVAAIRSGSRDGVPGVRGEWHPDFPRQDDVDAASLWHAGDVWGPRSIARGVTVLGSIGFFGPPGPAPGSHPGAAAGSGAGSGAGSEGALEVEVGYGLVREAWGWGFATEALQGLLAELDPAVAVRASIRPDNKASLRVVATCGFTRLRGTTDDGELVMVRPASR
jgi:RimJ/RimL family protein N-acetyltransferase